MRKSKDKVVNKEGRKLMTLTEQKAWCILNGRQTKNDARDGRFEFSHRRSIQIIINYILFGQNVGLNFV